MYENLTLYTEEDTTGVISETATRVTGVNVLGNTDTYLYKLYPVDYFDALDVDFEVYTEDEAVKPYTVGAVGFSDALNDSTGWAATEPWCGGQSRGSSVVWVRLIRGNNAASDTYIGASATPYYCTLTRVAGADGITALIYSDTARTDLLDTLVLAGLGTDKYKYAYGFVADNQADANRQWNGYIQNIDLNIASPIRWDFFTWA